MNYLKSFTDQLVTNFVALFILSQLFKHEHFCRKYALISRTKSISCKNRKKNSMTKISHISTIGVNLDFLD